MTVPLRQSGLSKAHNWLSHMCKGINRSIMTGNNQYNVSNLSFLSKVSERIVLSQLNEHLDHNNLLSPLQSAYRPKHSTETALLRIVNDLLTAMDNNKICILTLLDLSVAFDTIDHQILLTRLQHYFGISGPALSWFSSYLCNRTQSCSHHK